MVIVVLDVLPEGMPRIADLFMPSEDIYRMRDVMHKNEYKARNLPSRNPSQSTPLKSLSVDRKARLVKGKGGGDSPVAEGMGVWKAGESYGSSDDDDEKGRQREDQQEGDDPPAGITAISPGEVAVTEGQAVQPLISNDMLIVNGTLVTRKMLEEVLGWAGRRGGST